MNQLTQSVTEILVKWLKAITITIKLSVDCEYVQLKKTKKHLWKRTKVDICYILRHYILAENVYFVIDCSRLTTGWETTKVISSPGYVMCTIRRKAYSLLTKCLRTKPNVVRHTSIISPLAGTTIKHYFGAGKDSASAVIPFYCSRFLYCALLY